MTDFQVSTIDESESGGQYPDSVSIVVEPVGKSVKDGSNLVMEATFFRRRVTKQEIREAAEKLVQESKRQGFLIES